MIEREYWTKFYKSHSFKEPSSFARFVLPRVEGTLVDLGCGDGRDVRFFSANGISAHGVDAANEDLLIVKQEVLPYIHQNPSPDNVYTRFFWHAIPREDQLAILEWTKKRIFIEARTTQDKPKELFGKHKRNLVNPDRLLKDLVKYGFTIDHREMGYGLSVHRGNDPHLIRVVATKG